MYFFTITYPLRIYLDVNICMVVSTSLLLELFCLNKENFFQTLLSYVHIRKISFCVCKLEHLKLTDLKKYRIEIMDLPFTSIKRIKF